MPLVPSLKRDLAFVGNNSPVPQFSHYQEGSGWKQDLKMKYVQRTCHLCGYKTSLYCKCNPAISVCQDCFLKHIDISMTR